VIERSGYKGYPLVEQEMEKRMTTAELLAEVAELKKKSFLYEGNDHFLDNYRNWSGRVFNGVVRLYKEKHARTYEEVCKLWCSCEFPPQQRGFTERIISACVRQEQREKNRETIKQQIAVVEKQLLNSLLKDYMGLAQTITDFGGFEKVQELLAA
jgi:hypothetical protein